MAVLLVLGTLCAGNCPNTLTTPPTYEQMCGIEAFNDCGNANSFILLAFALVSFAIAAAYMYSKLREDPQWGVWAKDEAQNLLVTVLLFIGLLAFFTGSCSVAASYSGETHNPFDIADRHLAMLIQSNGLNILRSLTFGSLNNQFAATVYWYIGITPYSGSGVAEFANNRAYSAHKEFLMDLYLPIVASLHAQRYLLQAIQWVSASVLLPFAFVMRLVPPTREFGNVLIALFFTLYIVAPTLYAMGSNAYDKVLQAQACVDCGVHNFYSYGIDEGPDDSSVWKDAVLYKIGSSIPQAVLLPNIVIVVSITCVMALSKALRAIAV